VVTVVEVDCVVLNMDTVVQVMIIAVVDVRVVLASVVPLPLLLPLALLLVVASLVPVIANAVETTGAPHAALALKELLVPNAVLMMTVLETTIAMVELVTVTPPTLDPLHPPLHLPALDPHPHPHPLLVLLVPLEVQPTTMFSSLPMDGTTMMMAATLMETTSLPSLMSVMAMLLRLLDNTLTLAPLHVMLTSLLLAPSSMFLLYRSTTSWRTSVLNVMMTGTMAKNMLICGLDPILLPSLLIPSMIVRETSLLTMDKSLSTPVPTSLSLPPRSLPMEDVATKWKYFTIL